MAAEFDVPDFFQRRFDSTEAPKAGMLAVGISRRTFRKPQALKAPRASSPRSQAGPGRWKALHQGSSHFLPLDLLAVGASTTVAAARPISFELVDWMAAALKGKSEHRRAAGKKSRSHLEQTGSVAAPSQSAIITRPALPRSNQNQATMFVDCCSTTITEEYQLWGSFCSAELLFSRSRRLLLAADIPCAHLFQGSRLHARRKLSTTGPASISAAISAVRLAGDNSLEGEAAGGFWVPCRAALTISSQPTG